MPSSRERAALLEGRRQSRKFCSFRRFCPKSKAAILILVWNLIIVTSLDIFLDPSLYAIKVGQFDSHIATGLAYGIFAFLLLLYPLAGYLADVKWGRYKTIINSLCFMFWSMLIGVMLIGVALATSVPFLVKHSDVMATANTSQLTDVEVATIVLTCATFGSAIVFGLILVACGLIAFRANVIQFGIDQLIDEPSDHSVLFISWFVCTSYVGQIPGRIMFPFTTSANFKITHGTILIYDAPIIFFMSLFLGTTLCLHLFKRNCFLMDSGSKNPYKLVYKVFKFAKDHSHPIHRSAFTYCEDELPSRLDLGKEKYGGPFTTEEVEDVKVFWGILLILLTLGPILMVDISVGGALPFFASHLNNKLFDLDLSTESAFQTILFFDNTLTPLLIATFILLHLCLLQNFIDKYIPGMLKRIGIGMVFLLLSALSTLVMDTFGHEQHYLNNLKCFLRDSKYLQTLNISIYSLAVQSFLNALGYIFLYTAVYEFICAQSPKAMKGLLFGVFFAVKGVFQLMGITILFIPFTQWDLQLDFPSCGFVYYIINIIIAIIGIIAYTIVARQYQYRQRDDPDNIYRYAEEHYANENNLYQSTDLDYDNLNVETIA